MAHATNISQNVKDKASEYASKVSEKADEAAASVGSGLKSTANTVRENLPSKGVIGAASEKVADTLERSGEYLENKGLSGVSEDVLTMIKKNPIPAVLIGIGVGYLLACATRR